MVLSCRPTSAQDGMAFHAATLAFSEKAVVATGRWVTPSRLTSLPGRSAAKTWWILSCLRYRSVPLRPFSRYGTDLVAVPSPLGNRAARDMPLSPTSGIRADTYTNDVTWGLSAAAELITAPP